MIWVFSSCSWSGQTKQTTDPELRDKKRKHVPFFLIQTDTLFKTKLFKTHALCLHTSLVFTVE